MNERQIRDYQLMLEDRVRMRAFQEAIRRICPGRSVCDMGLGLGPLALMALRAGATRVYGIEADGDTLAMATRIIRANGFDGSRFVPIHGLSHQVELPERVDVLLSETVDSTGLGENTGFFMADAGERFLVPGGVFLPHRLDCYAALAHPLAFDDQCAFWERDLQEEFHLDYAPLMDSLRYNNQSLSIAPQELYSDWARWCSLRFGDAAATSRSIEPVLLEARRAGLITGVAMAFELELAEGVRLRTLPGDPLTHWKQGFSPFARPVACAKGDCLWLDVLMGVSQEPHIEVRTRHLHIRAQRVLHFLADLEKKRSHRRSAPGAAPGS